VRDVRGIFVVAAFALVSARVHAQTPLRPPLVRGDTPLTGEYAMEQETRERWMHGRQQPRFTPFNSSRFCIFVDSLRDDASGRRIHLRLDPSMNGRDSALIVVGANGRVAHLEVRRATLAPPRSANPADSARWLARQRGLRERGGSLAETRIWDFAPTFPQAAPHVGLQWTDTIARVAAVGPFRQSMRGARTSRIRGDTVIDGRRLWIVRDSATVRYEESYFEWERTLDTTVQVSRIGTGTLRGVHLYDPQRRLFVVRDDTTRLVGTAVLRYPDGRSFRTPARYERARRWRLNDSTEYAARMAVLRRARENEYGGMVLVPADEVQRRLRAGDVAVRDSIVRVWQRTTDPDETVRLFQLLSMWVRDEASRARLDSLRIANGDTAHLYHVLSHRAYSTGQPLDTADVRVMLRFMEDPTLAWSLDLSRDWLYENLVQALTTWPRAVSANGRSAMCTPDACRLLDAQWRAAREPRLRDVGLVALVTLDPRRWADTALVFDGPQHPLLHPSALLANGVGATWPAASKASLPAPNSDWRAWLEWMDGRDSRYDLPRFDGTITHATPSVRFEGSHSTAIRFYERRTGRDVVGDLRHSFDAADSDSARLVFGTMLQQLGEMRLTESQIVDAFISGVPARMHLARAALLQAFYSRAAARMSAEAATPFIDRLLAALADSAPIWRVGAADLPAPPPAARPIVHAQVWNIFLNGDSLPEAVRAKWAARILASAEWNSRDPRLAAVFYSIPPLHSWGRFVRIEVADSERTARTEAQPPAEYAASTTYYLMELNGEWVIVAEEGWVT
jgi:hypothetical protein